MKNTFSLIIFTLVSILSFSQNGTLEQSIILGRPTQNSITVNILFSENATCYLQYGTQSATYTLSALPFNISADTPKVLLIDGLTKNTKYFYKLNYTLAGTSNNLSTPEYTFQTQRDTNTTFSFTIEADEHLYDRSMGSGNLYKINLSNQKKDNPDFMISLGDIFGDDNRPTSTTSDNMKSYHKYYRQYLGDICHSVPFFLALGNHEGEKSFYLHQNPPNNIATWATLWRKYYYNNPFGTFNFYSGNTSTENYGIGNPENYYSWVWGDALFVVLDIYRYQSDSTARPTAWAWTLGRTQYDWLKQTLESNHSKYKFVFAHHSNGEERGGINSAKLFEWGGYERNGNYTFNNKRPGWSKPIHQLFVDNGVNIFFQGHDHLFAKEVLDGVVYQEVPMAADSTYTSGMNMFSYAYTLDTLKGSGHLKVTVSPSCINVKYIRAYLPADTLNGIQKNGETAFTYTIGNCILPPTVNTVLNDNVKIFPNPSQDHITISFSNTPNVFSTQLYNNIGQIIYKGNSKNIDTRNFSSGLYYLKINIDDIQLTRKIIICH